MVMFKKWFILPVFLFLVFTTYAHDYNSLLVPKKKKKSSGFDRSMLLVGPGLGFNAGYRSFFINLSPSVGYYFAKNFYAGVTTSFSYYQQTDDIYNVYTNTTEPFKFKMPIYSASIFGRYLIGQYFMLNVQPEINNIKYFNSVAADPITKKLTADTYRRSFSAMLVGLGYIQRFGEYSHTYFLANYDVLQNPNLPYFQSLDIRAGIMLQLFR